MRRRSHRSQLLERKRRLQETVDPEVDELVANARVGKDEDPSNVASGLKRGRWIDDESDLDEDEYMRETKNKTSTVQVPWSKEQLLMSEQAVIEGTADVLLVNCPMNGHRLECRIDRGCAAWTCRWCPGFSTFCALCRQPWDGSESSATSCADCGWLCIGPELAVSMRRRLAGSLLARQRAAGTDTVIDLVGDAVAPDAATDPSTLDVATDPSTLDAATDPNAVDGGPSASQSQARTKEKLKEQHSREACRLLDRLTPESVPSSRLRKAAIFFTLGMGPVSKWQAPRYGNRPVLDAATDPSTLPMDHHGALPTPCEDQLKPTSSASSPTKDFRLIHEASERPLMGAPRVQLLASLAEPHTVHRPMPIACMSVSSVNLRMMGTEQIEALRASDDCHHSAALPTPVHDVPSWPARPDGGPRRSTELKVIALSKDHDTIVTAVLLQVCIQCHKPRMGCWNYTMHCSHPICTTCVPIMLQHHWNHWVTSGFKCPGCVQHIEVDAPMMDQALISIGRFGSKTSHMIMKWELISRKIPPCLLSQCPSCGSGVSLYRDYNDLAPDCVIGANCPTCSYCYCPRPECMRVMPCGVRWFKDEHAVHTPTENGQIYITVYPCGHVVGRLKRKRAMQTERRQQLQQLQLQQRLRQQQRGRWTVSVLPFIDNATLPRARTLSPEERHSDGSSTDQ